MVDMGSGEMDVSCKWLLTGMGTGIVGLSAAVVYLAKGWLGAVMGISKERQDTIAQLNAAKSAAKAKGGSP